MRRAFVIAALLMFAIPAPRVQAHFLWHPDAKNDTTTADVGGDLIGVRLSTFRDDGVKMLRANADFAAASPTYHVVFLFDSRGGERADFKLLVSWDIASGGIYSWSLRRLSDHTDVDVRLYTKEKRTTNLPVWFEVEALNRTRHIRWRVVTTYDTKLDQAPDVGWFTH